MTSNNNGASSKIGLVMEGGAMRGMFTAGVLDVFMEAKLTFQGAVGVSAGAAFGCNIKSHQIGRSIRYNKKYCQNKDYVSLRSWLLTGDLYNADFSYNKIPYELDPFDVATFRADPMDFYVVCTGMDTGLPVYHNCLKGDPEDIQWLRASASIPIFSRPVIINGQKLSDGGTSDSIPLQFMESKGYARNVVILTQPAGFVKERMKHFWLAKIFLRKYPALLETLSRRPQMYNEERQYVEKRAQEGQVFVIKPPEPLGVGSVEHNPDELERVYQIGRRTAEANLEELKCFLSLLL